MSGGWGSGAFGLCPWGVCLTPALTPASAGVIAVAENVIRVQFNRAVYYSGVLDAKDASLPSKWSMLEVAGTAGLDGASVRPVVVAAVTPDPNFPLVNGYPTTLDLTLDRPMTPFPAAYMLTISNIWDSTQTILIVPGATTSLVPALFKLVQPAIVQQQPSPSRDFANPQTLSAMLDPLPVPTNPLNLGVFGVDDTGDYAFDAGLTSYKKRILRRLMTVPSAFLFLPGYGVGLLSHSKQLAKASVLQQLATNAQKQIALEPETESVRVTATMDPNNPGLMRFNVTAVPKSINKPVRLSVTVPVG